MSHPLKNYARSHAHSTSSIQVVNQIFQKCAHHAQGMATCIESNDDYKRFQHSEKIVFALTQFTPFLENSPLAQSPLHKEYQNFFAYIMTAVIEANEKKSIKVCQDMHRLLIEFANIWKNL